MLMIFFSVFLKFQLKKRKN